MRVTRAILDALRRQMERRFPVPAPPDPRVERWRADPATLLTDAGYEPDPWQAAVLRSDADRQLLLASRQSGKSLVAGAVALAEMILRPPALCLILGPTERQAGELFGEKLLPIFNGLGRPVPVLRETALSLRLANGSRCVSLPAVEATVRSFSGVRLLILDEAARIPDALYAAVRPMLAVSKGRLLASSTPFGKRGFFHAEWSNPVARWERYRVPVDLCPRITAEFLAEEYAALGDVWFAQEYRCSFEESTDTVFRFDDIAALFSDATFPADIFPEIKKQ